MKKALQLFILLIVLLGINGSYAADTNSVPEFLSSISVTVDTPVSSASGIAFTRKDSKGNDITFIWTAGHVVRHHVEPSILSLTTNEVIENFTNLIIIQDVITNGEFAYKTNLSATVIKCSPDGIGNDLAVLRVNGKFFNTNTVVFDLSGRIPKLGEPLYGLSSPYDEGGTFSIGICSGIGRIIDGLVYDQNTLIVYPGSSGGGTFSPDGKCVGLNDIMRAPSMSYIIPIRRMQKWAKQENIEWALDPTIPMPSEKELQSIPRDDQLPRSIDKNKPKRIRSSY